jgi:hypothetical protein
LNCQSDIDTWDDPRNFYCAGKDAKNKFYRRLEAYKIAARLVEKYS